MERGSSALKLILAILLFCTLVQGIYAAEEDNEASANSDEAIGKINDTQTFQWFLLLPIFLGSLLFLSWMCRFFDGMGSCFVTFLVIFFILGAFIFRPELFGIVQKQFYNSGTAFILFFVGAVILIVISMLILGDGDQKRKSYLSIARSFMIIFAVLTWPLILFYFYMNHIVYITFYGIEELKFPVYIIAASSIGILSYLLLSIEETFGHLVPEYEKLRIAWSYIKRILIAPFIAIIGFYLLNSLRNTNGDQVNDYFVFAFAFFAGVFTRTIEEWIYSSVQKLLPADRKNEFSNRNIYEVKESEFVKELQFDEDVAYKLYNAKIRKIDELADCCPYELVRKLNTDIRNIGEPECCSEKSCNYKNKEKSDESDKSTNNTKNKQEEFGNYSLKQARMYINAANKHRGIDKSEFVTDLKMDRNIALMLYFANITTIESLSNLDPNDVYNILFICNEQIKNSGNIKSSQYIEAHKILCEYYRRKIKEYINIAKNERAKNGSRISETGNT